MARTVNNRTSSNGSGAHSVLRVTQDGRTAGQKHTGRGTLIIIGGHEDKVGDALILKGVCKRAGSGRIVVSTVASQVPKEMWETYRPLFHKLGCKDVQHLHVEKREDALKPETISVLDGATAVFFTGGDQLKITSQLGDTPVYERLREIYEGAG